MGGSPFPRCRCGCAKGKHHPLQGCKGQEGTGSCLMGCRAYRPLVEQEAKE